MEFNPKKENERRVNNIVNVFAMTPYDEAGGGQELAKMNATLQDLRLVFEHVEEKAAEVQESFLDQERMECVRHTLAGAIGQIKKAKGE